MTKQHPDLDVKYYLYSGSTPSAPLLLLTLVTVNHVINLCFNVCVGE